MLSTVINLFHRRRPSKHSREHTTGVCHVCLYYFFQKHPCGNRTIAAQSLLDSISPSTLHPSVACGLSLESLILVGILRGTPPRWVIAVYCIFDSHEYRSEGV